MTPITITVFSDFAARVKREQSLGLVELADAIRSTSASSKAALPWMKLAKFGDSFSDKHSLRHDANVVSVSGIEADYDGEEISFDQAVEVAEKAPLRAVIYTSPSHTADKPRWRVLALLGREHPPAERSRFMARLNGLYRGIFAVESFTLSQSYYFGHLADSRDHRVEIIEGQCIDELHELDLIAIGKPNGAGPQAQGAAPGPLDEAALKEAIVSGAAYHVACVRLVGKWAQAGVPFLDAQQRLEALFDSVFPIDRDQRWRERRADIPRIIVDIYGKQARQLDERVEFTIGGTRGNGQAAPEQEPEEPQRAGFTQAEFRALVVPPADRLLGAPFTTTTRGMLVGATGVGKTNLMLGMAVAMSEGKPFLHWPAGRRCRCLYVDGEMSVRLFKERSADAARRNGGESETLILLSAAAIGEIPPLNYPAGQRFIDDQIAAYGGFDFIFFDNIQALLLGDMKDEEPWRATLPWVRRLTNRSIGQLWGHHTGVDKSRGYGTSTREWQMDCVILLQPAEAPGVDLSFSLEFPKARERTPANRGEFDTTLVTLTEDAWLSTLTENKPRAKDRAFELLLDAIVRWGEIPPPNDFIPPAVPCVTEELWKERCARGSISEPTADAARVAFKRAAQRLIDEGRVGKWDRWIWVIR